MDTAKRRPRAYHPGLRLRGSHPPRVCGRPAVRDQERHDRPHRRTQEQRVAAGRRL